MRFISALLIALVLFLPSCSLMAKAEKTLDQATEMYEKYKAIEERLDLKVDAADEALETVSKALKEFGVEGGKIVDVISEVREKLPEADVNQDGSISGFNELWGLIVIILNALGIGFIGKKGANDSHALKVQADELR